MEVIRVNDVWKKYRIYHDKGSTLKEKILFKNRNRYEDRWVLKGVTLNIQKGDTIGLIGENGSGKSTLLKLLTRIAYPNKGEIEIKGKVSSLLELGAGFHPDMTGRENIYTNASIFGLTREEIDNRLDDIISFSELEEFIDNPVRTYSSGMYMRLAFSVAINVEADILLVDEILAVGDLNFQRKCFSKMQKLKKEGITIVLVSHDLGTVEKLCDKATWIREGRVEEYGDSVTVCKKYLQYMIGKNEKAHLEVDSPAGEALEEAQPTQAPGEPGDPSSTRPERWGSRDVVIYEVSIEDMEGNPRRGFYTGDPMVIRMKYRKNRDVDSIGFGIAVNRVDGIHCYGTNTFIDEVKIDKEGLPGEGSVKFVIDKLSLVEGTYTIDVAVHDKDGFAFDYRTNVLEFDVNSDIKDVGVCRLFHKWEITN